MSLQPIKKFDFSIYLLVMANIIPILGILFFNWNLFSILAAYWVESVIIGVFNVIKMIVCTNQEKTLMATYQGKVTVFKNKINNKNIKYSNVGKFFLIPFFIMHYGIFTLIHGMFILAISAVSAGSNPALNISNLIASIPLLIVIPLFVSHTISLFTNYIGKKEYEKISVGQLMFSPYKRVIIMHLTIVGGGFIMAITGAPILLALLFVILKIFIDIRAHNKEHSIFGVA